MNKFECIDKNCVEPKRSTAGSCGYDFIAPHSFVIPANGTSEVIDTGVAIQLDRDKVLMCCVRSSWGFNKNINLVNNVGIIDSDFYPHTIKVKFRNLGNTDLFVDAGEKMMQGIILQYFKTDNDECETIRNGGIGSTGV